jgi:hypothetical protein
VHEIHKCSKISRTRFKIDASEAVESQLIAFNTFLFIYLKMGPFNSVAYCEYVISKYTGSHNTFIYFSGTNREYEWKTSNSHECYY